MIRARIFRDEAGDYTGYSVNGHAGYGKYGTDIVCAAVSILAVNTANALEALTGMPLEIHEEEGSLDISFLRKQDESSALLMDAFVMGLRGIEQEYGKKHLRVEEITEVCHAEN